MPFVAQICLIAIMLRELSPVYQIFLQTVSIASNRVSTIDLIFKVLTC